jgi:hypothetical protein
VGLQHPTSLELLPGDSTELQADDQIVLLQASRRQGGLYDRRASSEVESLIPAARGTGTGTSTGVSSTGRSSFSDDLPSWEGDGSGSNSGSGSGSQDPIKLLNNQRMMDALFSTLDGDLSQRQSGSKDKKDLSPESFATMLQGAVLICGWRPGIAMVLKTLDKVRCLVVGGNTSVNVAQCAP